MLFSTDGGEEGEAMKKIMFVALVVLVGLAVILDDGRPRTRRR